MSLRFTISMNGHLKMKLKIGKFTAHLAPPPERSESGGGAKIGPREKQWGSGAEIFVSHTPFRITEIAILATPLCEKSQDKFEDADHVKYL